MSLDNGLAEYRQRDLEGKSEIDRKFREIIGKHQDRVVVRRSSEDYITAPPRRDVTVFSANRTSESSRGTAYVDTKQSTHALLEKLKTSMSTLSEQLDESISPRTGSTTLAGIPSPLVTSSPLRRYNEEQRLNVSSINPRQESSSAFAMPFSTQRNTILSQSEPDSSVTSFFSKHSQRTWRTTPVTNNFETNVSPAPPSEYSSDAQPAHLSGPSTTPPLVPRERHGSLVVSSILQEMEEERTRITGDLAMYERENTQLRESNIKAQSTIEQLEYSLRNYENKTRTLEKDLGDTRYELSCLRREYEQGKKHNEIIATELQYLQLEKKDEIEQDRNMLAFLQHEKERMQKHIELLKHDFHVLLEIAKLTPEEFDGLIHGMSTLPEKPKNRLEQVKENTSQQTFQSTAERTPLAQQSSSPTQTPNSICNDNGGLQFLKVRVIEGKDLISADLLGKSDPVLLLTVGREKKHTSCKPNTLSPVWNEDFRFAVEGSTLKLELMDKDWFSSDPIGQASIHFDVILLQDLKRGSVKRWIPLSLERKSAGQICISLEGEFGNPNHISAQPSSKEPIVQNTVENISTSQDKPQDNSKSLIEQKQLSLNDFPQETIYQGMTHSMNSNTNAFLGTPPPHPSTQKMELGSVNFQKVTSSSSVPSPRLRSLGILTVHCLDGSGWKERDNCKTDPYCKLTFQEQTKQTMVQRNSGAHTVWNQDLTFTGNPVGILEIVIFNHDSNNREDILGKGVVDIAHCIAAPCTIQLQPQGQVRLHVTVSCAGWPPGLIAYTTSLSTNVTQQTNSRRLIQMLQSLGQNFNIIDVLTHSGSPTVQMIQQISGSTVWPQLFMGSKFIGHFEEINALNEGGQLLRKLDQLKGASVVSGGSSIARRSPQRFEDENVLTNISDDMTDESDIEVQYDSEAGTNSMRGPRTKRSKGHCVVCNKEKMSTFVPCPRERIIYPRDHQTAMICATCNIPLERSPVKTSTSSQSCIAALMKGYPLMKYNLSNAKCTRKWVVLTPDCRRLQWASKPNSPNLSVVYFSTISSITYNFLPHKDKAIQPANTNSPKQHLRFSLVTEGRTVDFEAADRGVFVLVFIGLHSLIYPDQPSITVGRLLWKIASNLSMPRTGKLPSTFCNGSFRKK